MIDIVTANGSTALHSVIEHQNVPLVEYLLMLRPAAISAKDVCGYTPFDWALINKSDKIVKAILTLMPDIINIDSYGNTVLHTAAKHFSLQEDESTLQRVFDSHEKDIKTPNKDGDTPYHVARTNNNLYMPSTCCTTT